MCLAKASRPLTAFILEKDLTKVSVVVLSFLWHNQWAISSQGTPINSQNTIRLTSSGCKHMNNNDLIHVKIYTSSIQHSDTQWIQNTTQDTLLLCPRVISVYQDAASVWWLIFHIHIAKMENSCHNLVNCHLITFINPYNENRINDYQSSQATQKQNMCMHSTVNSTCKSKPYWNVTNTNLTGRKPAWCCAFLWHHSLHLWLGSDPG